MAQDELKQFLTDLKVLENLEFNDVDYGNALKARELEYDLNGLVKETENRDAYSIFEIKNCVDYTELYNKLLQDKDGRQYLTNEMSNNIKKIDNLASKNFNHRIKYFYGQMLAKKTKLNKQDVKDIQQYLSSYKEKKDRNSFKLEPSIIDNSDNENIVKDLKLILDKGENRLDKIKTAKTSIFITIPSIVLLLCSCLLYFADDIGLAQNLPEIIVLISAGCYALVALYLFITSIILKVHRHNGVRLAVFINFMLVLGTLAFLAISHYITGSNYFFVSDEINNIFLYCIAGIVLLYIIESFAVLRFRISSILITISLVFLVLWLSMYVSSFPLHESLTSVYEFFEKYSTANISILGALFGIGFVGGVLTCVN